MLKNKYLKYNPSITFEIFEKIYDKLIGQGWNTSVPKHTLYSQFSGGTWPYIVNNREKEFYSRHNSNNQTEITVQELLGYDPFVSDDLLERWLKETKGRSFSLYELENHISTGATCPYEEVYLKLKGNNPKERAQILYDLWNSETFTLPKKWCIAVNKLMPDFELISEWRKKTSRYGDEYRGTAGYLFEDGAWNNINYLEVPELTMDQFKKWVFKSKEFTLPLKWRVIATSEAEGKLLIPYANEKFKISNAWNNGNVQKYYLCVSPDNFTSLSKNDVKLSEYEEITFAQFKQYVLKETLTNTEKDWTKVSKEELLAEANKRYPIGTKYRNKPTGSIYILESKLTIDPRNNVCDEARQCHVFLCGKWAEIVELAKKDWNERDTQEVLDEAIRRYPIGTIVMSPVVSNDKYTVLKTPAFFKENKRVITDGDKKVTLFDFDKNTWAEIVKETQPEKWSVGTYVVLLKDYGGHPKGTIDKIIRDNGPVTVKVSLPYNGTDYCNLSKASEAKWFATKSEAEAFAKTQFEEPMSTEDDLTGRYLRATVDHPQSTSLKKGDIIKILDQFSLVSYQIEKGWTYTTNNSTSSDFEVLPKDYKPESTSPNLNFQHNEFYRVTLSKYSYIFLFTDAKLEKEIINTITYYNCSNKKCFDGGFIYLNDITVCERVPFETIKRDYSELYCKIYSQPKSETPSKFEVGKWYSQDASGNAKNFRKCSKVHTDHFEYDEYINRGVWKKDSAHTYWYTPHLADMEVVNKIINDHISRTEPKSKLYEGYTVGDYITITREPKLWSSRCNRKNLLTKVSYPFTAKITRIKIDGFDCHIEAGDGGWSLDHMLKNSCVRKATSEEIGNLIHNEMNKLLNIPYKFASEHSVIASKNFDDEIDFIYLSED